MPDVVKLGEKVVRVCSLNRMREAQAPMGKTDLVRWLGVAGGRLSKFYSVPVATLGASLERAIVMALGFGPDESAFEQYGDGAWSRWLAVWGNTWRTGDPLEFEGLLEREGYFVARPPDDPRLKALLPKIRGVSKGRELPPEELAPAITEFQQAEGRYLDRLASIEAVCVCEDSRPRRVRATLTFGAVEVPTDDVTYLVSINRCHAELLFREGSFEPSLEKSLVESRSRPVRQMKVEREMSRINHPSWLLVDNSPKTPLKGEYPDLELGVVQGEISPEDEASLIVHKAGFLVSALSSREMDELGILTSLLRYLVTEHVGEIEQRGSYLYHLSPGPILLRGAALD